MKFFRSILRKVPALVPDYGLWINKTPQEDWLFKEIGKLHQEWSDAAGVLTPKTQEAQAVLDKFKSLIGLAKREILALND